MFSLTIPTIAQAWTSPSGGVSVSSSTHRLTLSNCDPGDRHSAMSYKDWTSKLVGGKSIPAKAKLRSRHFIRCPKGPNHRKVMLALWIKVENSLIKPLPDNYETWIRIGRCEQPGSGYAGIDWSNPGPTYQGGLGIWYGNWDSLKPKGYPSDAGQATWRQQMEVANRLAARYGFGAWGCY